MTVIVHATAELLKRFYGESPKRTQKAVAAVKDGKVIGVAGVYVDDERQVMFADLTDEILGD